MLRGILRNLVQQALARSHEADSTLAPQVVDLLFCYCPLLLSYGRKPSERASARPPLFGSELLFACLSLGRFDATQRRFHRIYWGVFMDSDVAPDSIPTGEHLASSDSYPDRLGTLALRHRLGLLRVMREYERKVERCSSFYNEKRPSQALAETLRSLLEAFTTAMCHAREDFMRAVSESEPTSVVVGINAQLLRQAKSCAASPRTATNSKPDAASLSTSSSSPSPSASTSPPTSPRSTSVSCGRLSTKKLWKALFPSPTRLWDAWPRP